MNGSMQNIFIIGSKSIGQYGGFETFVDSLIEGTKNCKNVKFHVACKANGVGAMDETILGDVKVTKRNSKSEVIEFNYKNARVFKIHCPKIGPAVAIYYDLRACREAIRYCKENRIENPIFYVLACRIGLGIKRIKRQIHEIGGRLYLNPDGHEWKRAKWSKPEKWYWKWSEKQMISKADLIICDSLNIEKYITTEYGRRNTCYISYGAEVKPSSLSNDDPKFNSWLKSKGVQKNEYYLIVGRFVPENNYEVMIREFIRSASKKSLVIICNENNKLEQELERKLHFNQDARIIFAGTVYDRELLKKIRENASGYLHGHEVGGTNPSLLEALGSTSVNLLLDVGFNREVGLDAALYWDKNVGSLSKLIESVDAMSSEEILELEKKAKKRVENQYSWEKICREYLKVFGVADGS